MIFTHLEFIENVENTHKKKYIFKFETCMCTYVIKNLLHKFIFKKKKIIFDFITKKTKNYFTKIHKNL